VKQFRVELTASAAVSTAVYVRAETEKAAKEQAVAGAKSGNVLLNYDGTDDSTVEVEKR
jgi:hypothetical protein